MIGYKVIGYDGNKHYSLYSNELEYDVKVGEEIVDYNGIYLATDLYTAEHYLGLTDNQDTLLICSYDDEDLIKGNPFETGEVVVRRCTIENIINDIKEDNFTEDEIIKMKEIYKLAHKLDLMNLKEEANILLGIAKYAAPIVEMFESDMSISDRTKKMYDDESHSYSKGDFANSLEHHAVNMFQINLNFDSVEESILRKVQKVFGIGEDNFFYNEEYGGLSNKHILSGKTGSMEVFKEEFPDFWNRIKKVSKEEGVDPNTASVLFFHSGKFTDPFGEGVRSGINRDPYYTAHDMGHPIQEEIWEFIINYLNKEIFPYYKNKDGEIPVHSDDFSNQSILVDFFNDIQSYGEPSDIINDIIGLAYSDSISTIAADEFVINGIEYHLGGSEVTSEEYYDLEGDLEDKLMLFEEEIGKKINELIKKYEGKVMLFLL